MGANKYNSVFGQAFSGILQYIYIIHTGLRIRPRSGTIAAAPVPRGTLLETKSPPGHRLQRRRRSRARAAIRRGRCVSLRARTLLALHHATSKDFRRRLLHHMGRGQKPWQTPQAKANAQGRWDDTSGWEYWSGGFSPSAGQVPWKARPQPKAGVRFPGFEDIVLPSSATAMPAGLPTPVINVEEHRDAVLVSERSPQGRTEGGEASSPIGHRHDQVAALRGSDDGGLSERVGAFRGPQGPPEPRDSGGRTCTAGCKAACSADHRTGAGPDGGGEYNHGPDLRRVAERERSHLSAVLQRCFGSPGARTPTRLRPGVPLSPTFHGKTQAHYVASQVQDPYFPSPEPGRMGCGTASNPGAAPAHVPGLIPGQGIGIPPMPATVPGDAGICTTSGFLAPPGLGPGDELNGAAPPLAGVAADVEPASRESKRLQCTAPGLPFA